MYIEKIETNSTLNTRFFYMSSTITMRKIKVIALLHKKNISLLSTPLTLKNKTKMREFGQNHSCTSSITPLAKAHKNNCQYEGTTLVPTHNAKK